MLKNRTNMNSIKINERQKNLLKKIAKFIASKRMTPPAVFFFETVKPLNYISSQVLAYLEPFLTMLIPRQEYNDVVKILEQRDGLEYFLSVLEDEESERLNSEAKAKEVIKNLKEVKKAAKAEMKKVKGRNS